MQPANPTMTVINIEQLVRARVKRARQSGHDRVVMGGLNEPTAYFVRVCAKSDGFETEELPPFFGDTSQTLYTIVIKLPKVE